VRKQRFSAEPEAQDLMMQVSSEVAYRQFTELSIRAIAPQP